MCIHIQDVKGSGLKDSVFLEYDTLTGCVVPNKQMAIKHNSLLILYIPLCVML